MKKARNNMDNAIEIEEVNDKTLAFYVATEKGWYPEIAKIFWKVNETKFTVIFDHGTPVLADATTGFAYERYKDLEEFNEKFPILLFLAYQHIQDPNILKEFKEYAKNYVQDHGQRPPMIEIDNSETRMIKQLTEEVNLQQEAFDK